MNAAAVGTTEIINSRQLATTKANIWILEDDPGIQIVYEEMLGQQYNLRIFDNIDEFSTTLQVTDPKSVSLLIADIRLPKISFLSYLKSDFKGQIKNIPYVVVSSLSDADILKFCFDQGASDFIVKPFTRGEIITKVERALNASSEKMVPMVELDSASLTVRANNEVSHSLTSKEFQILTMVYGGPGHSISKDEIMTVIWGDAKKETKALDVHLANLRKKVANLGIDIRYRHPGKYVLLFNF
jgi:DNA-binding response OmpR family regulator